MEYKIVAEKKSYVDALWHCRNEQGGELVDIKDAKVMLKMKKMARNHSLINNLNTKNT